MGLLSSRSWGLNRVFVCFSGVVIGMLSLDKTEQPRLLRRGWQSVA